METIKSEEYQKLAEEFTFYLEVTGYSESTIKGYNRYIRDLFLYMEENGVYSLNEITGSHLESFYALQCSRGNRNMGAGLKLSTLNAYGRSIKSCWNFCMILSI